MISYRLNKNLSLEKVGSDVQKLVDSYQQEYGSTEDLVLTIRIVKIFQESVEHIPKLEYKKT